MVIAIILAMTAQSGTISIEPWDEAAVFGGQSVKLDGNALVDHVEPVKKGNVRSNKLVKLSGNVTVKGDVLAGDKIEKNGSGVTITGIEDDHAPILSLPALKAFIESKESSNQNASIGLTSAGTNPLSGSKFELQGAEILTLQSGEYFFSDFKVLGESELKVSGVVTIYLTGKGKISGKAKVNVEGDPCNLRLLTSGNSVHFSGQAVSGTLVYAMLGDVHVEGKAEIFGAVSAKSAKIEGWAKVHHHSCEGENSIKISLETNESEKQFEAKPSGGGGRKP